MNDTTLAAQCVSSIKANLHLSYDSDLLIDFTANQGMFMEGAQALVRTALFYDRAAPPPPDRHPAIMTYDFLSPTFDFAIFNKTYLAGLWYDDVHVIGCPPAEQVEQCIAVASKFAQSISFLLPKNTNHVFLPNYQCVFNIDIPERNKVFCSFVKVPQNHF